MAEGQGTIWNVAFGRQPVLGLEEATKVSQHKR